MWDKETIPVRPDMESFVDEVDCDLRRYKWHLSSRGYVIGSKNNLMHRVIIERVIGRPLQAGELVDHINGNPLDNRRSNLRVATNSQNIRNSRRSTRNTSGYKGVAFCRNSSKNPWKAYIAVNGKILHLGVFPTPEAAHAAYCEAAILHYGEFANFGD